MSSQKLPENNFFSFLMPLIVFAAVMITFFPGVFFLGKIFMIKLGDSHLCDFSSAYYFRETIRQGIFPLWNPGSFCGHPLGADIVSHFGLANIFVWLLPNPLTAWNAYIMLSVFLAAVFSYFYLSEAGYSLAAATITGLIFAFAESSMSYRDSLGVFLPLSLWCIEKYLKAGKSHYVFFAFLSLTVLVISALPQFSFYICTFFVVYVWARSRSLGGVAIIALVGGAASFYLIRLLELLTHSAREQLWFVNGLFPLNLICFLFPYFFESPFRLAETNFFFPKLFHEFMRLVFHTNIVHSMAPPYISVFGIILAAWAWREKGVAKIFRVTFLFILFYLMTYPLFASLYHHIPILAQLPRIARLNSLFTFSLAVLAGIGLDRLLKRPFRLKPAVLFFGVFTGVLGGCLLTIRLVVQLGGPLLRSLFENYLRNHMLHSGVYKAGESFYLKRIDEFFIFLKQWTNLTDPSFWLPALFIILSLLLLALWQRKILSRNIFILGTFLLILVDLIIFFRVRGSRLYDATPEEIRFETQGIKFLQSDQEPFRIMQILDDPLTGAGTGRLILAPNLGLFYGLESVEGYRPLYPGRYLVFFRNFQSSYDKDPAMILGGSEGSFDFRMADFLNVKYFITSKEKIPKGKLPLVMEDEKIKIYKNQNYLPRAYMVHQAKVITDDSEVLSFLKSDQMNFRKQVVLEENPQPFTDTENSGSNIDEVTFDVYKPNDINLTVKAATSGFLVLSANHYPGWQAFLDGKPVKLFRANYTFQAIQIPRGVHQVIFSFRPKSFQIGALLSAFFLVISPFACVLISRWVMVFNRR